MKLNTSHFAGVIGKFATQLKRVQLLIIIMAACNVISLDSDIQHVHNGVQTQSAHPEVCPPAKHFFRSLRLIVSKLNNQTNTNKTRK